MELFIEYIDLFLAEKGLKPLFCCLLKNFQNPESDLIEYYRLLSVIIGSSSWREEMKNQIFYRQLLDQFLFFS
jgi:hypothetical protein